MLRLGKTVQADYGPVVVAVEAEPFDLWRSNGFLLWASPAWFRASSVLTKNFSTFLPANPLGMGVPPVSFFVMLAP